MATPAIRTPDQRLRIFVSSTLGELADERAAVRRAIERLRMTPVMFELGARPHPARAMYRAYLDQSQVFIGVYWERYGWVAPDETLSGIEDEYQLSAKLPRLVYLKQPAPNRESRLTELIEQIQSDDMVSYKHFTSPEELERLVPEDLAILLTERFVEEDSTAEPASTAWGVRLPEPPTSIIGRESDLAVLAPMVLDPDVRLVTLLGPGGIGKTRLGLELARTVAAQFPDGAVMVPLDTAREEAEVGPTIAASMGINAERSAPVEDVLVGAIGARRVLLFLDNFEQVLGAATVAGSLLERCPNITLLITSRATLGLRADHDYFVKPLDLPFEGDGDPLRTASVRLFLERARRTRPDFEITADNRDAVFELCRLVEGMPLAIELAAARVRMLSPAALLERLDARLELLVAHAPDLPERQRTLRATIEWSYELLTEDERRLLGRLSVFENGWTLESAEEICGGEIEVLDTLSTLVEHSLVTPTAALSSGPRFRMLEMIRAFAHDRLEDSGELPEMCSRHLGHFAALSKEGGPALQSPQHVVWLERLSPEWGNLRAAWSYALNVGDYDRAVDIGSCMYVLAWSLGRLRELLPLMDRSYELRSSLHGNQLGQLLLGEAATHYTIGDRVSAERFLDEFDAARDKIDLPPVEGAALLYRAFLASDRGDIEEVRRRLDAAEQVLGDAGDLWTLGFCRSTRGTHAMAEGRFERALQFHAEALELAAKSGNEVLAMQSRVMEAVSWLELGNTAEAVSALKDSLVYLARYPYSELSAYAYEAAAAVAFVGGDLEVSGQLIGAADMVRATTAVIVWGFLRAEREAFLAGVESTLGQMEFERLRSEGASLSPPQATALVRALVE